MPLSLHSKVAEPSSHTAAFIKVVETIIDGLKNRSVATKRDIFYRSVALFVKQAVVDSVRLERSLPFFHYPADQLESFAAHRGHRRHAPGSPK